MNSIISWVGGKKALRSLSTSGCPRSMGGTSSLRWRRLVLFGKPPDTGMEVYNDFNSDLANLFRCVKERPLALLKELNFLP